MSGSRKLYLFCDIGGFMMPIRNREESILCIKKPVDIIQ